MLKQVRKKKAYEEIVTQVRNLIEKGKLKKDDQLPNEKELCDTFKVSRSTVREAVLSLENMKLVERRQGDGTYVTASSEEALINPLATSIFQEKDDIIDIFALRKIVEPEIAQLASQHGTPEDIAKLEKALSDQETELAEGKSIARTDTSFHQTLAKMSQNKVLARLLFALVGFLGRTRERYLQTDERRHKSLDGHLRILAAVKAHNGAAARKEMLRHLEDVENTLYKKKEGTTHKRNGEQSVSKKRVLGKRSV